MQRLTGQVAAFFLFGSNDLTQMTLGFSRNDLGKLLFDYFKQGVNEQDPFRSIDRIGVSMRVQMALQKWPQRAARLCGRRVW